VNWSGFPGLISNLYRTYVWRRIPRLDVTVKCTGGGTGVAFSTSVSETGNIVPALHVVLTAELEGIEEPVFVSAPFDLRAGELGHAVRFSLERPKYGTLVKECNDAETLYGKWLRVTVRSGKHTASATWREDAFDPVTDRGRFDAMQEVWRRHAEGRPEGVPEANERRRETGLTDERYMDPE
jgi:hypothetical protein